MAPSMRVALARKSIIHCIWLPGVVAFIAFEALASLRRGGNRSVARKMVIVDQNRVIIAVTAASALCLRMCFTHYFPVNIQHVRCLLSAVARPVSLSSSE